MPLPPDGYLPGTPFIELQSVDSTNNYALAQIHAGLARPGTCYFAHEQVAGKGQRGKTWATEKGANITLTVVLKPQTLQPFQQFPLSASVSLAVLAFLSSYVAEGLRIKWPNDLYWEDRKLGGILIENVVGTDGLDSGARRPEPGKKDPSQWKWAVIGIGININQTDFPPELKNPVSLRQITGRKFEPIELAKELWRSINQYFQELRNAGPAPILRAYNNALYKRNETVKFRKSNRSFHGVVKSVNEMGQLTVEHSIEEQFDFGELEWLL